MPLYETTDLALITPTKDRPRQVCQLLESLVELDCDVGRIIVVASGRDIGEVLKPFFIKLPLEYHITRPGQIHQRNVGIGFLDETTRLVGTIDDDVVFDRNAVSEIIKLWNTVNPDTAGIGFNSINTPAHRHTWLKGLVGASVPEPGRILRSGVNTSIGCVQENVETDWLNGGATVWRQEILVSNIRREIFSTWAICEDLIFSFPLSRKYPLYVAAGAKCRITEGDFQRDRENNCRDNVFKGRARFLWNLYFVKLNKQLSLRQFFWVKALEICADLTLGALLLSSWRLCRARGLFSGLILGVKVLATEGDPVHLVEKNYD